MTTKLLEPLLANQFGDTVVSPSKVPVKGYDPLASPGVMEHDAVPVLSVVAVQVSLLSRVRVTGSPEIGADVFELVSTPETVVAKLYSPVPALTVKVVGTGGAATVTFEEAEEAR